jgi:hypothetical protein
MSAAEKSLEALMLQAQSANGQGEFEQAYGDYGLAYELAKHATEQPDWLTVTRAARGAYETGHRIGVVGAGLEHWRNETIEALDSAAQHAGLAKGDLAIGTVLTDEHDREVVREMIQTNTVIGKITLRDAVRRERGHDFGRTMVGSGAEQTIIDSLREAERLLPLVEGKGPIDQYRINWHTPAVFGERLYGSRMCAARIAGQAVRYASLSESPKLPTSAGLPEDGRREAASRARKRSLAAAAAIALPRDEVLMLAAKAV